MPRSAKTCSSGRRTEAAARAVTASRRARRTVAFEVARSAQTSTCPHVAPSLGKPCTSRRCASSASSRSQRRRPAEARPGARRVDLQVLRLVRLRRRRRAATRRPSPQSSLSRSTIQSTGRASSSAGPKFHAVAVRRRRPRAPPRAQVAAERLEHVLPRPDRVRVADRAAASPRERRAHESGTRRSSAQSPPPITLPARAVATATGRQSPKNDAR